MSGRSEMEGLQELLSKSFGSALALFVAEIRMVMPAQPCGSGTQQLLQVGNAKTWIFDLLLYDQPKGVSMAFTEKGVIAVSASPDSVKALVWERKKAVKPALKQGVIVAREGSAVQLFDSVAQANAAGFPRSGFLVSKTVQARTPPALEAPKARIDQPASGLDRVANAAVIGFREKEVEVTQAFARCVKQAREELGRGAAEADVRLVAEMSFERLYGRFTAVSA